MRCSAIDRLPLISEDKTNWSRLVYGRGGRDGDGEQMARASARAPEGACNRAAVRCVLRSMQSIPSMLAFTPPYLVG